MAVNTNLGKLNNLLLVYARNIQDPRLVKQLGQALSASTVDAFYESGLEDESGFSVEGLSRVGEPRQTATGWSISVFDQKMLGSQRHQGKPPRGTIAAFLTWYRREYPDMPRGFRKGQDKTSAWWSLTRDQKAALAQERMSGRFGGESGWGAHRAPYIWQHAYGGPGAKIISRDFITEGFARFKPLARDLIRDFLKNAKAP